jgi:hypothetical protein
MKSEVVFRLRVANGIAFSGSIANDRLSHARIEIDDRNSEELEYILIQD